MNTLCSFRHPTILIARFKDRQSAEHGAQLLTENGYDKTQLEWRISASNSPDYAFEEMDDGYGESYGDEEDRRLQSAIAEGAGIGGALGVLSGSVIAALSVAVDFFALPLFAMPTSSPLSIALMGAGLGGIIGGLIGASLAWLSTTVFITAPVIKDVFSDEFKQKFEHEEALHWQQQHGQYRAI